MTLMGRVSPFGYPRINGCSHLPAAFRSVPRPSSPLYAKASTKCPLTLDLLSSTLRTGENPHRGPARTERAREHVTRFAVRRSARGGDER